MNDIDNADFDKTICKEVTINGKKSNCRLRLNAFTECDSNGNMIHTKIYDGYESWCEYDSNGNEIHEKDSNGCEVWKEYDDKGNIIHLKRSDGYEKWCEYDAKGNMIHSEDSDGDKDNMIHKKGSGSKSDFEECSETDDKGNLIYFKDFRGYESRYEYDDNGNIIYIKKSGRRKDADNGEYINEYTYNPNGTKKTVCSYKILAFI